MPRVLHRATCPRGWLGSGHDRTRAPPAHLALGEWCCALFLPFLAIVVVGRGAWTAANLAGAVALAGILLGGGTYWWLKLRQVRARDDRPAGLAAFAVYRWLGWVLGAAGVVVALLQWGDPWLADDLSRR